MATEKPMRRITVDEVKAAYRKTGLRPERFLYYEEDHACALGALLIASGVAPDDRDTDDDWRECAVEHGFSEEYVVGFERGFDGLPREDEFSGESYDELGYADGRACAAAVFGEEKA